MDKNFNEEELSDIMKEIEALEENLQIDELPTQEKSNNEDYKSEVVSEDLLVSDKKSEAEILDLQSKKKFDDSLNGFSGAPASMTFKVSGNMFLELRFEVNGQCVDLGVDEKGLNITLDNGAFFRVPLKKSA